MRKWVRRALVVIAIAAPIVFTSHMLHDVEHTGNNILVHGVKIIDWSKADNTSSNCPVLFASDDCVSPQYIKQGEVYDCRFLSSIASFVSTARGQAAVRNMIDASKSPIYTVNFAGVKTPLTVEPLSQLEDKMYSKALNYQNQSGGEWLPVLEKAYGQYRNSTQPPYFVFLRTIKHFITEGRLTPQTKVPGYGATFGGTDDGAIKVLSDHDTKDYSTFAYDCGDFGFGNGYVTWRQLKSWFNRDKVRQEYLNEQDKVLQEAHRRQAIIIATSEQRTNCPAFGLRSGHAYGVIGYNPKIRCIKLRDPYGNGDFKLLTTGKPIDGVDDGIFELSLYDFNVLFSHLRVEQEK